MGAAVGAVLAKFLDQHHAYYLQEQLDRGGLLVWVLVRGTGQERKACNVLSHWSADDVHLHGLPEPHPEVTKGVSCDLSFMNRLGL